MTRPEPPAEPPAPTATTERRIQTICLLVLTAIAVGAALQALSDVMIPFALAVFLAIALAPVVDGLSARTRLSRPLSVALTAALSALFLAVLGGLVASSIRAYEVNFDFLEAPSTADAGGPATEGADDALTTALKGWLTPRFADSAASVADQIKAVVPKLMGLLGALLSQGVTVLIFLMFLLVEQGRATAAPGEGVGAALRARVKQYISVKVLTSAVTGIAVGLVLWAIGVPAAVLFGLLTFLLNFIPTIGSVVAVALPIPLLLIDEASGVTIALAIVLPGGIQFAVGQVWENKLLGEAFDLRASVVLLGLVFWGKIWGIVGMLLATPIIAVLKTLMEGFELTRPVARLMGQGDGALAPVAPSPAASAPAASAPAASAPAASAPTLPRDDEPPSPSPPQGSP